MAQNFLFSLFIIALLIGAYAYFFPSHPMAVDPIRSTMGSDLNPIETTYTKRSQQLNMTTSRGILQVLKRIDDLIVQQQKLADIVEDEKQALKRTEKEISDMTDRTYGKSGSDLLKIKALGLQIQNEKSLLVAHGRELIALNDQIDKNRRWIVEQNDVANVDAQNTLSTQQQQNTSLNDRAGALFDRVTEQNNDSLQHTQALIDEEHQKSQDQQESSQQRIADQMQRIRDQENR